MHNWSWMICEESAPKCITVRKNRKSLHHYYLLAEYLRFYEACYDKYHFRVENFISPRI